MRTRYTPLLLLALAAPACGPSPPGEPLLEFDGGLFDGLQILRHGTQLHYGVIEGESFVEATLTPAGEQKLAEVLALATRGREYPPCSDECGFLGCAGTGTIHNTDESGEFELHFCATSDEATRPDFSETLQFIFYPIDCESTEFATVEAPCPRTD